METIIEFKNIRKAYGSKVILDNFSTSTSPLKKAVL